MKTGQNNKIFMAYNRFGYEWSKYSEMDPNYEEQFQKWVYPLTPSFFAGKKILDAGCGMGRNSYWALKYGAGEVVAFDSDERTVRSASNLIGKIRNAKVELASIFNIPYENYFDLVFSIGVIHHLESPELAIKNMVKAAKPGAMVLIWVYGYEGNEWVERFVSPVRKLITSRINLTLLDYLTYFVSLPFFVFVKLAPMKNSYLQQLKRFKFKHIHSIIFDQLLPQIAKYYKKNEAKNLLIEAGLKEIKIYRVNNNSWTVTGVKS